MVNEALNDGTRFAGACRGTGAGVGAVVGVGTAVSLEKKQAQCELSSQESERPVLG